MLAKLEIVTLFTASAICVAAAWTTSQQYSPMRLVLGAPSIVRGVPASGFSDARSFLREEHGSFDQVWIRPFS
jgi:hypothetical protein